MNKILKNTTGSSISLTNIGKAIPASSQITIEATDYLLLAEESSITEITPLINSGDVVVNNGSSDLSASQGILYISYPNTSENVLLDSLLVSGTNVKEGLESIQSELDIASQIFEYVNNDITTDLNTSTSSAYVTTVPIFGTAVETDPAYTVDLVGQYVTINFTGTISISYNIHVESTDSRVAPQFRTRLNGTATGPVSACTYIRATNNHNESSAHVASFLIDVTNGDQISIGARRGAKSGTAVMSLVGTSNIAIGRIK